MIGGALGRIRRIFTHQSLRFQLLSRSLFVMALMLLLVGILQYFIMEQFLYRNKASTIQSQVMAIPHEFWLNMANGPRRDNSPDPRRPFAMSDSVAYIDLQGNYTLIAEAPNSGTAPKLSEEEYMAALRSKERVQYKIVKDDEGIEKLVVLQPIGGRGRTVGLIQATVNTRELNDVLTRELLTFLLLALLALVLGLLTFLPVLRRTLVPLSNMVGTVERIDAGNLNERFPTEQGQLEIDRLSVSFNGMLERLEASFAAEKEAKERMRRFVADASHELRTPLTSIHGFLEILLRGAAQNPDQLNKALNSMYGESERINKLVQDLLLLARLDRTPTFQLAEGNLDGIVRELEPHLRILAKDRQVSFRVEQGPRCHFDADKMKQVILNLFHNAVQHTDPVKGHIEVSLEPASGGVELAVRDNGPGIAEDHLPHIFDRFYRIDTSRARKYGGAGLGLAITKSIVDIHGGRIYVESKLGEGTAFKVWFPSAA
ncbi:sensor histidine kinase [Paenibacillus hamazuiensis]|uniref:sensor histidine kinase n=1 Tax=Paenibacillus hamazuiensis TaxID=2936508 RepID=UPI00200F8621|nr:HAMP domain-containing sensor histidine kinase [Paenibacillus hamazuiensis]